MEKRREQRRHFLHCNVAGFMYADGCMAFEELKMGTKLELEREEYNSHDHNAVAIYYKDMKLGFIKQGMSFPFIIFAQIILLCP